MRSIWIALCALATPVAGAPLFEQPIECTLGESCFLQNYVDQDPGPDARDFTCGPLAYDGHKGTDFALPSLAAMDTGVNVLAAAPGVVTGTRDGMADVAVTAETIAELDGKDCGNGVAIDHGEGWVTQYCHMKRGTIAVRQGQEVTSGDILGEVGLSGRTQFPHLHISVRHNGEVIDPFQPETLGECGTASDQLWATPITYVAGGLIRAGFETGIPSYHNVKSGAAGRDTLAPDAPALVIFSYGFGSRPGDILDMSIRGPKGEVITQQVTLEKNQAQYFRAIGKRTPAGGWPAGDYLGTIRLLRGDDVLDTDTINVTVK